MSSKESCAGRPPSNHPAGFTILRAFACFFLQLNDIFFPSLSEKIYPIEFRLYRPRSMVELQIVLSIKTETRVDQNLPGSLNLSQVRL